MKAVLKPAIRIGFPEFFQIAYPAMPLTRNPPMKNFLNKINAAATVLLSLSMISALRAAEALPRDSPNVIIIYSDDHGYTDLGLFGIDSNVDTPNMDALASGGALMTNGYSSAPQCRPHASA